MTINNKSGSVEIAMEVRRQQAVDAAGKAMVTECFCAEPEPPTFRPDWPLIGFWLCAIGLAAFLWVRIIQALVAVTTL